MLTFRGLASAGTIRLWAFVRLAPASRSRVHAFLVLFSCVVVIFSIQEREGEREIGKEMEFQASFAAIDTDTGRKAGSWPGRPVATEQTAVYLLSRRQRIANKHATRQLVGGEVRPDLEGQWKQQPPTSARHVLLRPMKGLKRQKATQKRKASRVVELEVQHDGLLIVITSIQPSGEVIRTNKEFEFFVCRLYGDLLYILCRRGAVFVCCFFEVLFALFVKDFPAAFLPW